jgi:hypothetical protein
MMKVGEEEVKNPREGGRRGWNMGLMKKKKETEGIERKDGVAEEEGRLGFRDTARSNLTVTHHNGRWKEGW